MRWAIRKGTSSGAYHGLGFASMLENIDRGLISNAGIAAKCIYSLPLVECLRKNSCHVVVRSDTALEEFKGVSQLLREGFSFVPSQVHTGDLPTLCNQMAHKFGTNTRLGTKVLSAFL